MPLYPFTEDCSTPETVPIMLYDKGKFVSHIFPQKSVLEFESIARLYINQLLKRWD